MIIGLLGVPARQASGSTSAPAAGTTIDIVYDQASPQTSFAAGDVEAALTSQGFAVRRRDLATGLDPAAPAVVIGLASDQRLSALFTAAGGSAVGPRGEQEYAVRTTAGPARYWVLGGDLNGAMYGAFDVAEHVAGNSFGSTLVRDQKPFVQNRGVKFNLPLDEDAPTYFNDNIGDSHTVAIEQVWDIEFWKTWFDEMARNRFNVLSLWTNNPFVSMLDMSAEGYPNVHITGVTSPDGTEINNWTIAQKTKFWQDVMAYGRDRGFDIHVVTWNIFLNTADGEHGISKSKNDPETITYFRKSMKKFLETFPDLTGFGVTAGEGMSGYSDAEKENWLWQTYGVAMRDYAIAHPERQLTFIHRQHQTGASEVLDYFAPLNALPNVRLDMSFKYSKAHMLSTPTPSYIGSTAEPFLAELRQNNVDTWLELRTDSFFFLPWADPRFARAYITNFPTPVAGAGTPNDYTRGVFIGADGWVSTRQFTSKDPFYADRNALEIQKNWLTHRLWGQLLYDPTTPDSVFVGQVARRFPTAPATDMFRAWSDASRAVQLTNEQLTSNGWNLDFWWWTEAWSAKEDDGGWKSVNDVRGSEPMKGSKLCSIGASADGTCGSLTSAFATADEIGRLSNGAIATLATIKPGSNRELALTLSDLQALSYLGSFNAHKFKAALALEQGKASTARAEMAAGYCAWINYSTIMDGLYIGVQTQRNTNLPDWRSLDDDALADYRSTGGSGTPICDGGGGGSAPTVKIVAPIDGATFTAPANVTVDVQASDADTAVASVELRIDGNLVGTASTEPYQFALGAMTAGTHTLTARAIDTDGKSAESSVVITVTATPTGGLPWSEAFDLADGSTSDRGSTPWTATRSTGALSVQGGVLQLKGAGGEGTLQTGEIAIGGSPVTVSLDVKSQGRLEANQDYVRLFARIDGGPEVPLGNLTGNQSGTTITATGVTGTTLQLVARAYVSYKTESYFLDNLNVASSTAVPPTTVPATTIPAPTTVPPTTVPATTVPATTVPATVPTATQTVTFSGTDQPLTNPERGFHEGVSVADSVNDSTTSSEQMAKDRANGLTLARMYVRLDDYRDGPLPAAQINALNEVFANARAAGIKLIPRFTYNFGSSPDASVERIEQHLAQLTPVLRANSDVIATLQAGFIGAWGEWHSSSNGLTNPADRARVRTALMNALPVDRMVQFRYPRDLIEFEPTPLDAGEAFDGSAQSRTAHKNDCFLANEHDAGTYFPLSRKAEYQNYISTVTQYTVMGGETCQVSVESQRTACPTALSELAQFHWDYLNLSFYEGAIAEWRSGECFDEIERRLGYRYRMTAASASTQIQQGRRMALDVSVTNEGFGKLYNPRPINVVLVNDATGAITRIQVYADARSVLPLAGATTTLDLAVDVPAGLAAGRYSIHLELPDASPSLATDPRYSIQMANADTWRAAQGTNDLNLDVIVTG